MPFCDRCTRPVRESDLTKVEGEGWLCEGCAEGVQARRRIADQQN